MNINNIIQELNDLGDDWADKNAAAQLLEDSKPSILGEGFLNSEGKSISEKEYMAKSSDTYKTHCREAVEARRLANRARVKFDAFKTKIELTRTVEANKRQELKTLGG